MRVWANRVAFHQIPFVQTAAGILTVVATLGTPAFGADVPQDNREILRYNPVVGKLLPVPENEAKTGCVYSYFSERLNRRVWAIRQADGRFFGALGEGTTQPGRALDMRESTEAKLERLEQVDNRLLQRLRRQGGSVYFRLNKEGHWELDPYATFATVYDAETKFRWEWARDGYVPVSSAPFAYQWRVVDGRYIPIENPLSPADCPCFCALP